MALAWFQTPANDWLELELGSKTSRSSVSNLCQWPRSLWKTQNRQYQEISFPTNFSCKFSDQTAFYQLRQCPRLSPTLATFRCLRVKKVSRTRHSISHTHTLSLSLSLSRSLSLTRTHTFGQKLEYIYLYLHPLASAFISDQTVLKWKTKLLSVIVVWKTLVHISRN